MITKKYILATIAFVAISAPKIAFGASREELGRELLEAVKFNKTEDVRRLIAAEADLNQAGYGGVTPLIHAMFYSYKDTVQMLLDAGADVNQTDRHGGTPLTLAMRPHYLPIIKRLIDAGADVNHVDEYGDTPLIIAIRHCYLPIVKCLIDAGVDVNQTDRHGRTPLMRAIGESDIPIVKCLIDAGADVNCVDDRGWTPLILAVCHYQMSALYNGPNNVVRILLNEGANVHAKLPDGTSALRMAYIYEQQNYDLISLLLNHGAFPLSGDEIRSIRYLKCPKRILQLQTENSEKRCDALKAWCEYIDEEYDVPVDLQRLIVRDMLGANIDYSRRNVEHQWSLGSIASWFRKKIR